MDAVLDISPYLAVEDEGDDEGVADRDLSDRDFAISSSRSSSLSYIPAQSTVALRCSRSRAQYGVDGRGVSHGLGVKSSLDEEEYVGTMPIRAAMISSALYSISWPTCQHGRRDEKETYL
jgi:hypothetical protein